MRLITQEGEEGGRRKNKHTWWKKENPAVGIIIKRCEERKGKETQHQREGRVVVLLLFAFSFPPGFQPASACLSVVVD